MSSRLLAATLLAVGLAGSALAAQVKAPDAPFDAATHDAAVGDLATFLPVARPDATVWPTTGSWTVLSAPAQRIKAFPAALMDEAADHAVAAPASPVSSPLALSDGHGTLSRLVLGGHRPLEPDNALNSFDDVLGHFPGAVR